MISRLPPVLLSGLILLLAAPSAAREFPGSSSDWNGYLRHDFQLHSHDCIVVEPKEEAPGRPWIWRARFWGHEPQTDLALLAHGFHVAYIDVADLYGNPEAVGRWDAFHRFLTQDYGFAPRPALEGMSRGGLIVFNWAAQNPEKVACIYADAPVCDIKSWPGGLGKGTGNSDCWKPCLAAHGLDEESVLEWKGNPVDRLEPLAAAGIPLLHVCGDADEGVPYLENTKIVEDRYQALGGPIKVILKPGVGHHPHSLEDPKPIVDFILRNTCGKDPYSNVRGDMSSSYRRFSHDQEGRVAFLGGSITEMEGWRDLVCDSLRQRFPKTRFDFINAGIASTDSTLGAHRLRTDVFQRGPVDLLFVDFAVNDRYNNRTFEESVRGMEGIVRQAKTTCPQIDIVFQYFVDPIKMDLVRKGVTPPEIEAHESVAARYHLNCVDEARSITDRIEDGEITWEQFADLHPSPFGQRIYARAIDRMFDTVWPSATRADKSEPVPDLPEPLDPSNYENGAFLPLEKALLGEGWNLVSSWQGNDEADKRNRFLGVPTLEALHPGAELHLDFEGRGIGLYLTAGPDVGILEYSIDSAPPQRVDPFTEWSPRLHIPWALILESGLSAGPHRLVLRTTEANNQVSVGNACRILQFLVH